MSNINLKNTQSFKSQKDLIEKQKEEDLKKTTSAKKLVEEVKNENIYTGPKSAQKTTAQPKSDLIGKESIKLNTQLKLAYNDLKLNPEVSLKGLKEGIEKVDENGKKILDKRIGQMEKYQNSNDPDKLLRPLFMGNDDFEPGKGNYLKLSNGKLEVKEDSKRKVRTNLNEIYKHLEKNSEQMEPKEFQHYMMLSHQALDSQKNKFEKMSGMNGFLFKGRSLTANEELQGKFLSLHEDYFKSRLEKSQSEKIDKKGDVEKQLQDRLVKTNSLKQKMHDAVEDLSRPLI